MELPNLEWWPLRGEFSFFGGFSCPSVTALSQMPLKEHGSLPYLNHDLSQKKVISGFSNFIRRIHLFLHIYDCLISVAVACPTARLNTCLLAWSVYRPGLKSGPVCKVMSSEFRCVCYRINILGSQLSPCSINLVPAQAGKVTVGLASHWRCVTVISGCSTTGSRPRRGRWAPAYALLVLVEYGELYLFLYAQDREDLCKFL